MVAAAAAAVAGRPRNALADKERFMGERDRKTDTEMWVDVRAV